MRAIDLETRVITAVDQIRAGQHAEHDLIECKRSWPQEQKARQLAGSLNRAGGDPVVYIIGIDEKTGKIHDVWDTDIIDWWAQILPQFDQTPPELVRHLNVQVGEGGEHVVAMAISSDRAPYVVKAGKGSQIFEVPMREGTSTRSARRDELLRMLIPNVRLPQIVILEARLYGEYYPPSPHANTEELNCTGRFRVYVEHHGQDIVTMPAHGMRGRVTILGERFDLEVKPPLESAQIPSGGASFAFQRPSDGVIISGPRAISLQMKVMGLTVRHKTLLHVAEELEVEIAIDVLHAITPLKLKSTLARDGESNLDQLVAGDDALRSWTPGGWHFKHPGLSFDD